MTESNASPISGAAIGGSQPFSFSRPKPIGRPSNERYYNNAETKESPAILWNDAMSANDYHRILGIKEDELKTVHEQLNQALSAMRQLKLSIDQARQREQTLLRLNDQFEAENCSYMAKVQALEDKNRTLEQRLRQALLENRELSEGLNYFKLKWSEEQTNLLSTFAEYEETINYLQKENENLIEKRNNETTSSTIERSSSVKKKISQNRLNSTAEIRFLNEELKMKGLEIDRLSKELATLNSKQTSHMEETFDDSLESELDEFMDSSFSCDEESYMPEVRLAHLSLADELQDTVMQLSISSSSLPGSRSVSWNFSDSKPLSRTASRVPSIGMQKRSMSDMGPLKSKNSMGKILLSRGNRAVIGSLYPSTSLIFERRSGDILNQHEQIRIKHDGIRAGHGTQLRLVLPAAGHLLENIYKSGPNGQNNHEHSSGKLDLEID